MKKKIIEKINFKSLSESKLLLFFICLTLIFITSTLIFSTSYINLQKNITLKKQTKYTRKLQESAEDRYIPVKSKVTEDSGAYISRGKYDIKNSKYFKYIDIYNMKSSGSLILLEKFKIYQQTSEYTCGIASLIMAINYLSGDVLDEKDLAFQAKSNEDIGTNIHNLEQLVTNLGYEYESKTSFTEENCPSRSEEAFSEYIKEALKNNEPIIVISNDWGGHYSVIIGYDTMGTEDYIGDDVIILADPYDTTDHMSDGYTIFSFERYYAQMQIKVFNVPDQDLNFIRIKKKNNQGN